MVLVALAACGGPPSEPEAEVRALIAEGVELAEAKDRRALMDMVSTVYGDARGNSREDIGNILRFYFLRAGSVKLVTKIEEIDIIDAAYAKVNLTVGMAGTTDLNALGFSADAYRFEIEMEKDGDDWQVFAARWGEVGSDIR